MLNKSKLSFLNGWQRHKTTFIDLNIWFGERVGRGASVWLLGKSGVRPTLVAPRCPIGFCQSGPPLQPHLEHENFLWIPRLTLATDQTIPWKTMKVYWLDGTRRTVGEKTSNITFCFKKSAISPPWTKAWIVLIFKWFICLFLLFFFLSKIVITLRPIIAA